jgi:cellulose synthase/poly-beta-1,6-N-acetylglucosamine synthase-like glycosyltransferase
MFWLELLFITCITTIVFTYGFYGPIMAMIKSIKGKRNKAYFSYLTDLPSISLIVPAYNEENWIARKINNCIGLSYPADKFEIIVITDGSTDHTNLIASTFDDEIMLLHESSRNGKIKAMDRAAKIANNEILVFTDANTLLNFDALLHIGKNFDMKDVGMVSGEKKVRSMSHGESADGEGIYWKYESWLKQLDSDVASVIGAAGELFAIRSELYDTMPVDTLLDDFMLSSRVIELGYNVVYEPKAFATEYGSASYKDEWKRKVRICAGGIQSTIRSSFLFNFKRFGWKSFSFIVHRVSRWTAAPFALLLSFILSGILFYESNLYSIYFLLGSFSLALTLYSIVNNQRFLPKPLLLIVYFTFMHISAIAGWFRYFSGNQNVNWQRSTRLG